MNRSDILDAARQAVTVDRAATHGDAENGFALIAALWSADLGVSLAAVDVARLMVLFKMARAKANPGYSDNWIDAAGYSACGGEIGSGIAFLAAHPKWTGDVPDCVDCGEFRGHGHVCRQPDAPLGAIAEAIQKAVRE